MSGKIATFKDLDTIASLVEGTTSGYISGAISNMCVSRRNFDIVSSKTIAAADNGLILKDNSDSLEYDSNRLILKKDVQITKTKCTIILSGESKTYHNTASVKCTASVDGKLYWGESESDMENLIEISAGVEVEVISRTSVGTTAIYAYFVPTNPIYPTLGGIGDSYASASAEITKANDAGISVTTYSGEYNGSSQKVAECTDSHGTSEWYIGYTTTDSSTDVTWGEKNTNLSLSNAGTYYIWKKWIADDDHDNSNEGIKIDAEVTIKKKDVTVTAGGSRKEYDGNAYTYNRATLSGMVSGHTLNSYTCTGSITDVGSVDNIPSDAKIVDANSNDVTANYNITYVNGIITITQRPITFTASNQSKRYDGTALTADNKAFATSGSLVSGHSPTFTCSGSRTTVGTSTKTLSDVKINSGTTDVTSNYSITKKNGTLTVSKATPTLTLTGVTKTYDGNTYYVSAKASVAGTIYYGTTSGSRTYKTNAIANTPVNLAAISRTTVGATTVYAYLVPTDSTNYNSSGNVRTNITINQAASTLSYTPEDISTYCLNSNIALVKSQIVECAGAQGGGQFNYEMVVYDQEGTVISGFDINKYYLWTIEEGDGVTKGIVTYKRNPMEMTLSDIVCIYLVDGQGVEDYVGLDNHRDVDEPWTHVANTSTDGENILKLAWSADGGEGIDEYTFGGELSNVPFDTVAISMPEGLSVGNYRVEITVKQADSNYVYDEVMGTFILSVLPDEHTGVYDGTLSINSSDTLSAGDDSRVITWGAVYTNWKYGGDKVYYSYPSNLRIECNNSDVSRFVSIDNMSYSNSEQVTTSVLTKQSFRDTSVSTMPTYKISLLTYNGSFVKSIDVLANKNQSRLKNVRKEYGTPTITIGDTLTPGSSSATVTCEVWNKNINTYTWTSGYESERVIATMAGSADWSIRSQKYIQKNGIEKSTSRFSKDYNNAALSHSSMEFNMGTDIVTIFAANLDAISAGVTTPPEVEKTISVYNDKRHTLTKVDVSYAIISCDKYISTPAVTFNTSYKYLSGAWGGTTTNNRWSYSATPSANTEFSFVPTFSLTSSITTDPPTINSITGEVTWGGLSNNTPSPKKCYVNCSATLTSQGLITNASLALPAGVIQAALEGKSGYSGDKSITFYDGSQGTNDVTYSVLFGNEIIPVPSTLTIGNGLNPCYFAVDATNTGSTQRYLKVRCTNASNIITSMSPANGLISLRGGSSNMVLISVASDDPINVVSVDITITIT